MNHKPSQPVSTPGGGTPDAQHAALIARRRLLRGSLGMAPVLMASAPRSVMATTCVPASSFASINASRPDMQFTCQGRSPGYWKNHTTAGIWPAPFTPATKFNSVFGAGVYDDSKTLLDVLKLPGNDMGRDALARHIVAALLNAKKNLTRNVLSVDGEKGVKAVWRAFVATGSGYYEPTAGIKWYANYSVPAGSGGLIPWLKSTMTV